MAALVPSGIACLFFSLGEVVGGGGEHLPELLLTMSQKSSTHLPFLVIDFSQFFEIFI